MLIRDTLRQGPQEVFVEQEIVYHSSHGTSTTIPYHSKWKTLLVQTSGGLDSALMLYLTAKTFSDLGSQTQILPFSLEVPTKAKTLSSARAVINKVRELTQYSNLLPGTELHIPLEECTPPHKDNFFNKTILQLFLDNKICFEFNGNTRNPPENYRSKFPEDQKRQFSRDNRTSIYNGIFSASPHAMNDKRGVVNLYQQFNLTDTLAPLTLSCDMNLDELKERNLPVPCKSCWWCHERQWGFDSNGITDPAQVKTV